MSLLLSGETMPFLNKTFLSFKTCVQKRKQKVENQFLRRTTLGQIRVGVLNCSLLFEILLRLFSKELEDDDLMLDSWMINSWIWFSDFCFDLFRKSWVGCSCLQLGYALIQDFPGVNPVIWFRCSIE